LEPERGQPANFRIALGFKRNPNAASPNMSAIACFRQPALKFRMIPKAMDSLDLVEAAMLIEEIFGTEIPDTDAENFGSPREMADWLERGLSNRRPNKEAAAVLRRLAKSHNTPELAHGLEGTWRRDQIAAIVREIFGSKGSE
jgi:Phosphopantetheine attachment site